MSSATFEDLKTVVRAWIEADPDLETQAELRALLAAADPSGTDLADRFAGALEFGTAGLRGVLGAGPNRMNRAVVIRTTWALAQYLLTQNVDAKKRGVVIGFDGRKMSREFASDVASVLAAEGIPSHVFEDLAPTPLTAFGVTHLSAAAGVMVTASHNPPEFNGYKLYWGDGAQIVPPIDVDIANLILRAPAARDVRRVPRAEAEKSGLYRALDGTVERAYLDAVRGLEVNPGGARDLRIVYTPLHGVGDHLMRAALAEARFTNVTTVPEQQKPDGAFPTVAFPNPEEQGAMDLSFALARKQKADLVLANDPDADRLAVAIPHEGSPSGYLQFTGNQVGVLLGHYLLTERKVAQDPSAQKRLALASLVSSPMLGSIALALGVHYEETLTGFKWIAHRAMDLEKEGHRFVFGYEEALGYTVGDVVRDKDGISAGVLLAEMAAVLKERGRTLGGEFELLARKYGLFVSGQINVTHKGAAGAEEIRNMMTRLRENAPERVGELNVVAVVDIAAGTRRHVADGKVEPFHLPKSNVIVLELASRSRIIVRPSGTEPKIKVYIDLREPVLESEAFSEAEKRGQATLTALGNAFKSILGI
ncbi:phospho-sugar mutase [Pendulispora rubella]|uniref:Phospho-sugar mutase n=1 Tax=Pendulispora rubella TaxID=2741070 RepID=A0ABZ2LBG4_9BACT